MVRVGLPITETATIRRVGALEPFVAAMSRELAAFANLLDNPAQHGFFVTDPMFVDLQGRGWESELHSAFYDFAG